MAKQINLPQVSNDSEVGTPPSGYLAFFLKDVSGTPVLHVKNSSGVVTPAESGVATVNSVNGNVELRSFDITQWSKTLPSNINVSNGSTYNLFESLTDSDKTAVSATNSGALSITQEVADNDHIHANWQNIVEFWTIRVLMQLDQGGTDYYRVQLRRKTDDSVVSTHPFSIDNNDMPEQSISLNILTYVGSDTDPFVNGGFYLLFLNNSGGTATITGNLNVLITRNYQIPIATQL